MISLQSPEDRCLPAHSSGTKFDKGKWQNSRGTRLQWDNLFWGKREILRRARILCHQELVSPVHQPDLSCLPFPTQVASLRPGLCFLHLHWHADSNRSYWICKRSRSASLIFSSSFSFHLPKFLFSWASSLRGISISSQCSVITIWHIFTFDSCPKTIFIPLTKDIVLSGRVGLSEFIQKNLATIHVWQFYKQQLFLKHLPIPINALCPKEEAREVPLDIPLPQDSFPQAAHTISHHGCRVGSLHSNLFIKILFNNSVIAITLVWWVRMPCLEDM